METWKILLIIFGATAAVSVLGGVIIGKVMLNRAKSSTRPILSKKERVVYTVSVLLGIALILFGVLYSFPQVGDAVNQDDELSFADVGVDGGGSPAIAVEPRADTTA